MRHATSGYPRKRLGSYLNSVLANRAAISFQATGGERAQVANHASLNFTTALTVEMWTWTSNPSQVLYPVLLCKGNVNTAYQMFIRDEFGDEMQFSVFNGGTEYQARDTIAVPREQWVHFAGVYDGSTCKLFRNGVEVASVAAAASISTNANPLWIGGGETVATNRYAGVIDEIRLWNVARTGAQILANMNRVIDPATAGLVAYYRFEDGTGLTAANSVAASAGAATLDNRRQWGANVPPLSA